jgi:hypothetical protein
LINFKFEDKIRSYISKLNYLPFVSFSKNIVGVKYEHVLPFNMHNILLSSLSDLNRPKVDPKVSKVQTTKFYTHEDISKIFKSLGKETSMKRGLVCSKAFIPMKFPVHGRFSQFSMSIFNEKETNTVYAISKSYSEKTEDFLKLHKVDFYSKSDDKPKKMSAYLMFTFMFTKYQKIDDKKVLVTSVRKSQEILKIRFI